MAADSFAVSVQLREVALSGIVGARGEIKMRERSRKRLFGRAFFQLFEHFAELYLLFARERTHH